MMKGVDQFKEEGFAMLYSIDRFIQNDLKIMPADFFRISYWGESEIQQWRRKHTEVQQLPVGLLMDLAELSREELDFQETLKRLLLYQREYYQQIDGREERYLRLLNGRRLIEDADEPLLRTGGNVVIRRLLNRLDEEVYQGPYQVLKGLNDQRLKQTIITEKNGSLKKAGFDFRVRMVYGESSYPLAYYHYVGRSRPFF